MASNLTPHFSAEITEMFGEPENATSDDLLAFVSANERVDGFPVLANSAAYGVAWARQTGRVPGSVDLALRALNGAEMLRLLEEVAVEFGMACHGVPRFLNERYATR